MDRMRLDQLLVERGYASTRSQAENYIKLGKVTVEGKVSQKPGLFVLKKAVVKLTSPIKYVSRAGLKLESVADELKLDFRNKSVLDVGSSTGGFSDYALQHGALRVIAVDVGTNQMDSKLRQDLRIELHEQTDIRSVDSLSTKVDYCLIDVSFISIRPILSHLRGLLTDECLIVAMVKPQFENASVQQKNRGVVKNEKIRRMILKDFETWSANKFKIINKADSKIAGPKGNVERFYLLAPLKI